MSAADRLNEIEARANAATEGPTLDRYHHGGGRLAIFDNNNRVLVADFYNEEDREFYAHARTDVLWLIEQVRKRDAALRAVLELHHETTAWAPPDETQATECAQGCTDSEGFSDYPCPTVRAIEEALK